jgi:hypothetical protein
MANAIYPLYKEALLTGAANAALNGSGSTGVYAALYDTGTRAYTAADQFYGTITGAIVGTPVEIGATKSYTNGVFDGADITFTSVTGNSAEAIVIYIQNGGANSTWRLVAFLDTNVTGLPVTPNSGNITITWNASGILGL